MSRPTRNKSDAPGRKGSPLLTGILLGMVFGVALAAGLAWYLLKLPSPFVSKEQVIKPAAEMAKPAVPAPKTVAVQAVPFAAEAKPRFEFYKVLTDKQDATTLPEPAAKLNPAENKPAENKPAPPLKTTYLQAGSFANAAEAENLKASLAMKGVESSVQTVTIPGKGVWHRVRVGPFHSEKEVNNARGSLKLIGLEATPTH